MAFSLPFLNPTMLWRAAPNTKSVRLRNTLSHDVIAVAAHRKAAYCKRACSNKLFGVKTSPRCRNLENDVRQGDIRAQGGA